jgi:hypothetical protein|tara:strand:+ start:644 stop:2086 length:1443 start_codon:yes stop_codon:yes gene_type:complete
MTPQSIILYHNIIMDEKTYPRETIDKFVNDNVLFKDLKLKKYFDRDEPRDLKKFRDRIHSTYPGKDFEKMIYVFVTDSIRDIILQTVGELTDFLRSSGDLIVSGGEAFNMYVDFKDRIVTSDIDAKFVPRMKTDAKYFGKLQALKLLLWNKLGQLSQRLNIRIRNRILEQKGKLTKFLGIGFKNKGPFVTRRYTLIKKKKTRGDNTPGKGDVFIDVELFALDLNLRYLSPKTGKIQDFTMGGILDIPFMRPNEFGSDVSRTKKKGVTYRNAKTGKMVVNNKIFVASKEFLIEDVYLMHKLKLRPEKKEKDRQRLIVLGKMFSKSVKQTDSIDDIFKKVRTKISAKPMPLISQYRNVNIKAASRVNPRNYSQFTTEPMKERLSKQLVHGLKTVVPNTKISNNYEKTSGNQRFDLKTQKWKTVTNASYVKNEQTFRPKEAQKIAKNLNVKKTLYGYRPNRNDWVSKTILNKSSNIPFVGLKK